MPRKPIGPVEAQAKAAAHLLKAAQAVEDIRRIMTATQGPTVPTKRMAAEVQDAAKAIEAAGCYIRRAHADHLLIP